MNKKLELCKNNVGNVPGVQFRLFLYLIQSKLNNIKRAVFKHVPGVHFRLFLYLIESKLNNIKRAGFLPETLQRIYGHLLS